MNGCFGFLHCPRIAGQGGAPRPKETPFLHFHTDNVHLQNRMPGGAICPEETFSNSPKGTAWPAVSPAWVMASPTFSRVFIPVWGHLVNEIVLMSGKLSIFLSHSGHGNMSEVTAQGRGVEVS